MMAISEDELKELEPLNRLRDRCDRCGSEAFVKVKVLKADGELLFCAHHANAFDEALKDSERFEILLDERQRLLDEAEEFKQQYVDKGE